MGTRDSVEKNDSLLSIEQNFYFVQSHIPLTLLAPLLQILLQAHAFLIDLLGVFLADIAVMPRLIHDARNVRLVRGIPQDESIPPAVFQQPFLQCVRLQLPVLFRLECSAVPFELGLFRWHEFPSLRNPPNIRLMS